MTIKYRIKVRKSYNLLELRILDKDLKRKGYYSMTVPVKNTLNVKYKVTDVDYSRRGGKNFKDW